LLHGDGILFADPVRLIVLDAAGRSIAYSHESVPMAIYCPVALHCVGYDHGKGWIMEFVPTQTYVGPVVTDGESAWSILNEPRNDDVNIRTRQPSMLESATANFAIARD